MRASSQLSLVTCRDDKIGHYTGVTQGVRDKIVWDPEHSKWLIKAKKSNIPSFRTFLSEHNFTVDVPRNATGDNWVRLRNAALIDACRAWNMLDKSTSHRIKINDTIETCPHIKVQSTPGGETDESGDESDDKSDEQDDQSEHSLSG